MTVRARWQWRGTCTRESVTLGLAVTRSLRECPEARAGHQGWYLILFSQNTATFRPRSGAKIRGFYRYG